jgi:hypothetical protein
LIAQAATATPARPAIISEALRVSMDDLRKFRHMERNNYGYLLDAARVAGKISTALDVVARFAGEVETFIRVMSSPSAGDADQPAGL